MLAEKKRLNQIFPTWASGGGIFSYLNDYDVPWKDSEHPENDISVKLDLIYHGNHAGKKLVSPLVDALLDENNNEIDGVLREQLASAVYAINELIWSKEWETLFYEYDPISNYDSLEQSVDTRETDFGKTHTQTNNLSHTKTGTETESPNVTTTRTDNTTQTDTKNLTDTRTDNTTQTDTKNLTDVSANKVYGFNSSVGVDDSERTDTHTGTDTVTNTGTVTTTDTGTDTVTNTGTVTNATSGTDQKTYNTTDADTGTVQGVDGGRDVETYRHELTRKGNIGVTTSQQMIQSERELDMWNYFYEVVFPSVDKLLTLLIY